MALFGGGSAIGSVANNSNIVFNPSVTIGEGNRFNPSTDLTSTQTVSPKLDESMTAAASLGFLGGTSGNASTQRQTIDDAQPMDTVISSSGLTSFFTPKILLLSAVGLGVFYFFSRKKGK